MPGYSTDDRKMTRFQVFCALCSILLVASSFLAFFSPQARAQSFEKFINDAGRAIGSTVNSAGSALSRAAKNLQSKKKSSKRRKAKDVAANQKDVAVPPLPQRRPRVTANSEPGGTKKKKTKRVLETKARPEKPTQYFETHDPSAQTVPSKTAKRKQLPVAWGTVPVPERKTNEDGTKTKPDVFTQEEIEAARAQCRKLLKNLDADTVAVPPIKRGPCGDAAPVKLVSLGTNPKVAISPPATVNCQMVKALHTWLVTDLQPLSKAYFESPITKIENMSSYSCRNAYGRTSTKLSEHGKANALDIRGFEVKTVKVARLLKHWGPTRRDIDAARKLVAEREAKRKAAEAAAKEEAKSKDAEVANKASSEKTDGGKAAPPKPIRKKNTRPQPVAHKLGGPKDKKAARPLSKEEEMKLPIDLAATRTPKARFLREAHKRACKIFGTVLGPEANNAHRNHFHVDLAPRKHRNYCR